MVTDKRELHYYVNGEDIGIAADKIPDTVYGFVDLYRYLCTPVKLIPDVREVKRYICIIFSFDAVCAIAVCKIKVPEKESIVCDK